MKGRTLFKQLRILKQGLKPWKRDQIGTKILKIVPIETLPKNRDWLGRTAFGISYSFILSIGNTVPQTLLKQYCGCLLFCFKHSEDFSQNHFGKTFCFISSIWYTVTKTFSGTLAISFWNRISTIVARDGLFSEFQLNLF